MRRGAPQMVGSLRPLRSLEHARRGAGRSTVRAGEKGHRAAGRHAASCDVRRRDTSTPHENRHGRVRPCCRWRACRRISDPDRRRSGHRQINPASSACLSAFGGRQAHGLCFRRGICGTGAHAGTATRAGKRRRRTCDQHQRGGYRRIHWRQGRTRGCGHRFDPDDVPADAGLGTGNGQPGPGHCAGTDPGGKDSRRRASGCRACHQGRRHRRAACSGTHGRHGSVFRR